MPNTEQSIEETGGVPEITLEVEAFGMVQTAVDKTLSIEDMAADAKATGDAIADVNADLADALEDIQTIKGWTAEDIPLSEDDATTIADAIRNSMARMYPVGSLYITVAASLPEELTAIGTWQEVAMPLTWNDIKHGTRSYAETETGFVPGTLHMWMRTA